VRHVFSRTIIVSACAHYVINRKSANGRIARVFQGQSNKAEFLAPDLPHYNGGIKGFTGNVT
jgi:hypothetical protein